MASAPGVFRSHKRIFRVVAGFAFALLGLCLLLVSFEPAVPPQRRSTARSIEAARGALRQLKQAQVASIAGAPVRLNNEMLQGLAALANDLVDFGRADARVSGDVLVVRVSIPVFPGWWLDSSAMVEGDHEGFPALKLRAGRLSLPLGAGKPVAELARLLLTAKGVQVPPLDTLVQRLSVDRGLVLAQLSLPRKTGPVDDVVGAGGSEVDTALTARIYCQLAAGQRDQPVMELAGLIRRAIAGAPAQGADRYNRAALVALSFYVVGEQAWALAPAAARRIRSCPRPAETILLADRADLAKHWTFSAALRAILGERSAVTLGEWKELSDSLPDGSGFSFVDLAADRSGIRVAAVATDERSAPGAARKLAVITEDELLPRSLLRAREGMSEADFIGRYGRVETANYQAVVRQIDAELREAVMLDAR